MKDPLFDQVLRIADNERMWRHGHEVFDTLRYSWLELDKRAKRKPLSESRTVLDELFGLGELVAKVTYNATDPPDPFDEDSGWWIGESLKEFVNLWNDGDFSKAAWRALVFDKAPEGECAQ